MNLDLDKRVALVAASTSGLGLACALGLAAEGVSVVVCSRDEQRSKATAADIARQTHARVAGFACDVSKPGEPERLVARCLETFGRLDILVTNAGGPPAGSFTDEDDAAWESAFALGFMSVVRFVRAALPSLVASGRGRIVNIASTSVKEPIDGLVLSNGIRPGVIGLARTLARELASSGVTVNNVCPGKIRTPRQRALYNTDEALSEAARQIPMGRMGEPSDLSPLVVFLASACAGYITGQTICVDGGLTRSLM